MTAEEAFKKLIENGFEIEQVNENEFTVYDNGKFGFIEEEDPFTVDGEELIEICVEYLT
jgi:hypothetical protein